MLGANHDGDLTQYFSESHEQSSVLNGHASVSPIVSDRAFRFPAFRSVLWDRTPLNNASQPMSVEEFLPMVIIPSSVLSQILDSSQFSNRGKIGSLVGKYRSNGDSYFFAVDSLFFDSGEEIASKNDRIDIEVVSGPVDVESLTLACFRSICSRDFPFTARFMKLSCSIQNNSDIHTGVKQCSISGHIVAPSISMSFVQVNSLRLVANPLGVSLQKGNLQLYPPSSFSFGYLTLDQYRNAVALLYTDALAFNCPLIGTWIFGQECDITLHSAQVWSSCMRFLFNESIDERVFPSPTTFLVLLAHPKAHSLKFFECKVTQPQDQAIGHFCFGAENVQISDATSRSISLSWRTAADNQEVMAALSAMTALDQKYKNPAGVTQTKPSTKMLMAVNDEVQECAADQITSFCPSSASDIKPLVRSSTKASSRSTSEPLLTTLLSKGNQASHIVCSDNHTSSVTSADADPATSLGPGNVSTEELFDLHHQQFEHLQRQVASLRESLRSKHPSYFVTVATNTDNDEMNHLPDAGTQVECINDSKTTYSSQNSENSSSLVAPPGRFSDVGKEYETERASDISCKNNPESELSAVTPINQNSSSEACTGISVEEVLQISAEACSTEIKPNVFSCMSFHDVSQSDGDGIDMPRPENQDHSLSETSVQFSNEPQFGDRDEVSAAFDVSEITRKPVMTPDQVLSQRREETRSVSSRRSITSDICSGSSSNTSAGASRNEYVPNDSSHQGFSLKDSNFLSGAGFPKTSLSPRSNCQFDQDSYIPRIEFVSYADSSDEDDEITRKYLGSCIDEPTASENDEDFRELRLSEVLCHDTNT